MQVVGSNPHFYYDEFSVNKWSKHFSVKKCVVNNLRYRPLKKNKYRDEFQEFKYVYYYFHFLSKNTNYFINMYLYPRQEDYTKPSQLGI